MRGKEQYTFALALGARVVFKPVIDDQALDIAAIQAGEVSEVSEHSSEILEKSKQDLANLALGLLREHQTQIEKAHAPEAWPKPIAQRGEHPAKTLGQRSGQ